MTFILAHITNREPLLLAFVQRYEPQRIENPRWVDVWEELNTDEYFTSVLIDLYVMYSTMKKVRVFRNRPLEDDDGSTIYVLQWATIHDQ